MFLTNTDLKTVKLFFYPRKETQHYYVHLFVLRNHSVNTPAGNRCQGYPDAVNVDKSTARASRLITSGDKVQPLATRGTRNTCDKYRCKIHRSY